MKSISMKAARIATAIIAICSFAIAHAAPAPQPIVSGIVADDGYLIVENGNLDQKLPPQVCPPGAVNANGDSGCIVVNPSPFGKDNAVAPVTPQQALDRAYGPNRAKLIGIAPQGWRSTVIYYRAVSATGR